jgi:hypothetical protein
MATGCGNHRRFVVPIHPVAVEEDEYADLPIYERIQMHLLDYYFEVALLQL